MKTRSPGNKVVAVTGGALPAVIRHQAHPIPRQSTS